MFTLRSFKLPSENNRLPKYLTARTSARPVTELAKLPVTTSDQFFKKSLQVNLINMPIRNYWADCKQFTFLKNPIKLFSNPDFDKNILHILSKITSSDAIYERIIKQLNKTARENSELHIIIQAGLYRLYQQKNISLNTVDRNNAEFWANESGVFVRHYHYTYSDNKRIIYFKTVNKEGKEYSDFSNGLINALTYALFGQIRATKLTATTEDVSNSKESIKFSYMQGTMSLKQAVIKDIIQLFTLTDVDNREVQIVDSLLANLMAFSPAGTKYSRLEIFLSLLQSDNRFHTDYMVYDTFIVELFSHLYSDKSTAVVEHYLPNVNQWIKEIFIPTCQAYLSAVKTEVSATLENNHLAQTNVEKRKLGLAKMGYSYQIDKIHNSFLSLYRQVMTPQRNLSSASLNQAPAERPRNTL